MTPSDLRASAVRRRRKRLLLRRAAAVRAATSTLPRLVVSRSPLPRPRTSGTPAQQPQETIPMMTGAHASIYTLGDRAQTVDAPSDDVRGRTVRDEHGEGIASAPGYDPLLVDDRLHHENLYDHHGHRPFWDWRCTCPSLEHGRSGLGSGS